MTPLQYYGRRAADKHPVLHYVAQVAAIIALLLLAWTTWQVRQLPERNCVALNQNRSAIIDFIQRQTLPDLKHATPAQRARILAYITDARHTFAPISCATKVAPW